MSTCVGGKEGAAVACYPHFSEGEEPLVVLIVTKDRDSFPIRLKIDAALTLSASLRQDADAIRPHSVDYERQNALSEA